MAHQRAGTAYCPTCGEQWPASLFDLVEIDGCPRCNHAQWEGVVPSA